jgi:hypothetical protein
MGKDGRTTKMSDAINPDHYKFNGVEVIQLTEQLDFLRGNAVKYLARAGRKGNVLEDLQKAQWYVNRAVANAEKPSEGPFVVASEVYDEIDSEPEPRSWDSLWDVPRDVVVKDNEELHWKHLNGSWNFGASDHLYWTKLKHLPVANRGPFVEVYQ